MEGYPWHTYSVGGSSPLFPSIEKLTYYAVFVRRDTPHISLKIVPVAVQICNIYEVIKSFPACTTVDS